MCIYLLEQSEETKDDNSRYSKRRIGSINKMTRKPSKRVTACENPARSASLKGGDEVKNSSWNKGTHYK